MTEKISFRKKELHLTLKCKTCGRDISIHSGVGWAFPIKICPCGVLDYKILCWDICEVDYKYDSDFVSSDFIPTPEDPR